MYNYKQKVSNKNKDNSKRKLVIIVAVAVIAVFLVGIFIYTNRTKKSAAVTDSQTINYEPATDEEKKQAEDTKEKIVMQQEAQQNKPATPSTQKTAIKPTITNTTDSINAYVNGIFEEGGVCTATFTKDGVTLSKTSAGFQNVSYTQCAPMNLESGFLSAGKWSVTVRYSSDKSEGTSESQTFEVNN